jgi:hypothetical protein
MSTLTTQENAEHKEQNEQEAAQYDAEHKEGRL